MAAPKQTVPPPSKGVPNQTSDDDFAAEPAPTTDPPKTYAVTLVFDTEKGVRLAQPKRYPVVVSAQLARVLVRAASIAPTSEPPLQFSTLLIAMLVDEDKRLETQLKSLQGVNFEAIARKRAYNEASLRSLNEGTLRGDYLASMSAREALEETERIARATSGPVLDIRHLNAAYPILEKWHLKDFADFQIDRLDWARAVGSDMARQFPVERTYWMRYADRAAPVPLTSFSADVYTQEDLLGIDRSVDALALLMASTRTVTPLAIGVFGPWGSGKSFFMRHLQKRIVGLRKDEQDRIDSWVEKREKKSAKPEDAPLYFGEIAQVEFNAWHYNEGNLVASLVEQLFRNLRILPNDGDKELDARRANMLMQLKVLNSDLTTVEATVATAKQNVETAKTNVAHAARDAAVAKHQVDQHAQQIKIENDALKSELGKLDDALKAARLEPGHVDPNAVIAVAFGPLAPFFAKVQGASEDARNRVFDWKEFFGRVFSTKGLVIIALCLLVPLVLTLKDVLEAQWSALMGSVAAIVTALGSALDVFKRSRQQFEAKLAALDAEQDRRAEEVRKNIQQQQLALTENAKQKIAALSADLETRRKNLAECETAMNLAASNLAARAQVHDARLLERVTAEKKVRAAEAELERLSSALLLEEFITERASTDEYRKQLGFLALVRRDIERLSKLIDDANREWLATDNSKGKPSINRIVLYIDDLDRCKESTVLAVLEAVHLLLAFPLFVCAVAVDPRWVEKCLREARKQMFIDEDAPSGQVPTGATATVGDYLEKIFQIPIWMSPIESQTRATLVNSLLGPTAAPAARATGNGADHTATAQEDQPAQAGAFNTLVAYARERPDPLKILPEEAKFVGEIADLLSDRPRALKRFVNTYRLLKASLPDIERTDFVTEDASSPHRACLIQLAFFTSHPRLASELVSKLEAEATAANGALSPAPKVQTTFGGWLEKTFQEKSPVRKALEEIPASKAISLQVFQRWLPLTSRYLFHRAS
ncbi:MAG: P-loop NTPase fold protein [Nitrospira sp.]|nr:P-loop NTPase fold protein [Nitrospira sp.]